MVLRFHRVSAPSEARDVTKGQTRLPKRRVMRKITKEQEARRIPRKRSKKTRMRR
jgi:hypothetical protein